MGISRRPRHARPVDPQMAAAGKGAGTPSAGVPPFSGTTAHDRRHRRQPLGQGRNPVHQGGQGTGGAGGEQPQPAPATQSGKGSQGWRAGDPHPDPGDGGGRWQPPAKAGTVQAACRPAGKTGRRATGGTLRGQGGPALRAPMAPGIERRGTWPLSIARRGSALVQYPERSRRACPPAGADADI
ncbi:hypothetical protein D3C79_778230 [compost metagenome]